MTTPVVPSLESYAVICQYLTNHNFTETLQTFKKEASVEVDVSSVFDLLFSGEIDKGYKLFSKLFVDDPAFADYSADIRELQREIIIQGILEYTSKKDFDTASSFFTSYLKFLHTGEYDATARDEVPLISEMMFTGDLNMLNINNEEDILDIRYTLANTVKIRCQSLCNAVNRSYAIPLPQYPLEELITKSKQVQTPSLAPSSGRKIRRSLDNISRELSTPIKRERVELESQPPSQSQSQPLESPLPPQGVPPRITPQVPTKTPQSVVPPLQPSPQVSTQVPYTSTPHAYKQPPAVINPLMSSVNPMLSSMGPMGFATPHQIPYHPIPKHTPPPTHLLPHQAPPPTHNVPPQLPQHTPVPTPMETAEKPDDTETLMKQSMERVDEQLSVIKESLGRYHFSGKVPSSLTSNCTQILANPVNSEVFAAGDASGNVIIFKLDTPNDNTFTPFLDSSRQNSINALAWNEDGTMLATGSSTGKILIYSVTETIKTLSECSSLHDSAISDLCFYRKEEQPIVVSVSHDATVKIHWANSGEMMFSVRLSVPPGVLPTRVATDRAFKRVFIFLSDASFYAITGPSDSPRKYKPIATKIRVVDIVFDSDDYTTGYVLGCNVGTSCHLYQVKITDDSEPIKIVKEIQGVLLPTSFVDEAKPRLVLHQSFLFVPTVGGLSVFSRDLDTNFVTLLPIDKADGKWKCMTILRGASFFFFNSEERQGKSLIYAYSNQLLPQNHKLVNEAVSVSPFYRKPKPVPKSTPKVPEVSPQQPPQTPVTPHTVVPVTPTAPSVPTPTQQVQPTPTPQIQPTPMVEAPSVPVPVSVPPKPRTPKYSLEITSTNYIIEVASVAPTKPYMVFVTENDDLVPAFLPDDIEHKVPLVGPVCEQKALHPNPCVFGYAPNSNYLISPTREGLSLSKFNTDENGFLTIDFLKGKVAFGPIDADEVATAVTALPFDANALLIGTSKGSVLFFRQRGGSDGYHLSRPAHDSYPIVGIGYVQGFVVVVSQRYVTYHVVTKNHENKTVVLNEYYVLIEPESCQTMSSLSVNPNTRYDDDDHSLLVTANDTAYIITANLTDPSNPLLEYLESAVKIHRTLPDNSIQTFSLTDGCLVLGMPRVICVVNDMNEFIFINTEDTSLSLQKGLDVAEFGTIIQVLPSRHIQNAVILVSRTGKIGLLKYWVE
ncbi:hypothetical protein RCL1_005897 [Eukaryota sp. TZLM3-RCL]